MEIHRLFTARLYSAWEVALCLGFVIGYESTWHNGFDSAAPAAIRQVPPFMIRPVSAKNRKEISRAQTLTKPNLNRAMQTLGLLRSPSFVRTHPRESQGKEFQRTPHPLCIRTPQGVRPQ